MTGRRLPDGTISGLTFAPGDYVKVTEGQEAELGWWIRPPRGHLGRLVHHEVAWHGFLERGVWREV